MTSLYWTYSAEAPLAALYSSGSYAAAAATECHSDNTNQAAPPVSFPVRLRRTTLSPDVAA